MSSLVQIPTLRRSTMFATPQCGCWLLAGNVQISGQAGLAIGPSVFYNRGTCNVQVAHCTRRLLDDALWQYWAFISTPLQIAMNNRVPSQP